MRGLLSVVTIGCLVALLSAAPTDEFSKAKYGDELYLKQQSDLLKTFKYMYQPYWNAEMYHFAMQYKIEEDFASYNNVEQVKEFYDMYKRHRFLERGSLFSLYDTEHLEQVKAAFNVLYNAKHYDTFEKVLYWFRFTLNEKMFMYIIGVAFNHIQGLENHQMPPMYEVCPYQFINVEAIKSAQRYKMQGFYGVEKVNGYQEVIIPVNYTGWYMHMNEDQKVSYFTEDVGLNNFYYNFNFEYPHWMEGKPYGLDKDRRGEMYLTMHHEIYARYYLERLSNDLGHVPKFNWREPFESGYLPHLMYWNGKAVASRSNHYSLYQQGNHKFVQEAEDRERRIRDIIDKGYIKYDDKITFVNTPEDVNTIGNLLQGNPDGFGLHHNFHDHVVPSFLENYATAARDPMFYSFYQQLLHNYWRFMSHMKPYTVEEIGFPGVEVIDSHVDKIETFFENFDVDITNALDIEADPKMTSTETANEVDIDFKPDAYYVKARTVRLNHKPFDYKLTVKSDAAHDASIRVYLGPKYDEYGSHIGFEENRKNFVILDIFKYKLKAGTNEITRNSDSEYKYYSNSMTSYFELYKFLMQAQKGDKPYPEFLHEGRCQFPKNLMIPKGKKGGMTYQFYYIISPYQAPKTPFGSTFDAKLSCGVGSGSRYFEDRPMLYPIDRPVDSSYFYTSNMHFEDVEIFFNADETNARFY